MNDWIDPRSRAWAVAAVIGGIGLLLGFELIEEPDAGTVDLLLEVLESAPIVLTSVGVVLLFQVTRRQRDEQAKLVRDLDLARAQGERWRAEARSHLVGLGEAIEVQFARWNLTDAEREVALLLLKGLSHKEIAAVRATSLERVPVIELAYMSEAQKRAYVLADNQLALNAGWDDELLRLELADLSELGFDLGLIGFGAGELERLLAGTKEGLTEDDEAPPLPEQAVTPPGDLWVLGEHRVLCGDATVLADVEQVLDGSLADMTWTDPPYNVDYGSSAKDKLRGNRRKILNDDLGAGFEAFLHDACANILSVTKGACYVCMSSSELHTLQRAFTAAGGKWSTFVIWAKHTFTLGRADYQRQYEPILYGWKEGSAHFWCGARDQGDVWFVDKPARNDLHPTMKPVALVERALRNSSKTRDIVLDPFGGSGSTLIACEKVGRQARLIELDPKYCDVIVQRWQDWTGGAAILDVDGRSYAEIAASREAA